MQDTAAFLQKISTKYELYAHSVKSRSMSCFMKVDQVGVKARVASQKFDGPMVMPLSILSGDFNQIEQGLGRDNIAKQKWVKAMNEEKNAVPVIVEKVKDWMVMNKVFVMPKSRVAGYWCKLLIYLVVCAGGRSSGDEDCDEVDKQVMTIDDFEKLSYHSESDENDSSFDDKIDHGLAQVDKDMVDDSEEKTGQFSIKSKYDCERLSFYSSSEEDELVEKDTDDSSDPQPTGVQESLNSIGQIIPTASFNKNTSVFDFQSSDSDSISDFTPISKQVHSLTPVRQIIQSCCNLKCFGTVSEETRTIIRTILWGKKNLVQKNELLQHLKFQHRTGLKVSGFYFSNQYLCPKSFSVLSELSIYKIRDVIDAFNDGLVKFEHGNEGGVRQTQGSINFICWMTHFISLYGQQAPDECLTVLPSFLSIKDIFEIYRSEAEEPLILQSTFYKQRFWKEPT